MTELEDRIRYEKENNFISNVLDKIKLPEKSCQDGLQKAIVAAIPYKFLFFIIATVDEHNCLHILDINNLEDYTLKFEDVRILDKIKREFRTELEDARKNSHQDEAWAKKTGNDLFNKLFETLIDKKQNIDGLKKGQGWVWIYCDDYFDSIWWEWLYTALKTPSNTETSDVASQETTDYQTEDGFFWGDRYNIIRLSKNCGLENPGAQPINKSNFIIDKIKGNLRRSDVDFLANLSNNIPTTTKLDKFNLADLSACECVHVSSDSKKFKDKMNTRISVPERFPLKLLFLNICGYSERDPLVNNILLKLIEKSIATDVWIHTGFDVPDEFAHEFAGCFYKALEKEKNVAKALATARNRIKTMGLAKRFWRLAYVATGNPCTEVEVSMDKV